MSQLGFDDLDPAVVLRATWTATAPDAVRTFRTYVTSVTLPD
ncbi:hypothetical protein [Rhodococcus aetherivorans]|nr:hypothetical protein [Rhodococcus aetherivorans]MDV6297370.1 hypothetical protein [Rhodococcus aetherivorans]